VSSPEQKDFALPLSDSVPREEPIDAPASIPISPPAQAFVTLPVQAPGHRTTGLASMVAPSSVTDSDMAPSLPPTGSEAGIVTVERSTGGAIDAEVPLDEVLLYLLEKGGSDLHLSVNAPPMIRVHGELEAVPGYRPLTARQLQETIYTILTERQKQRFEERKELDLAYELPGAARFRVNLMQQRGSVGAARGASYAADPGRVRHLAAWPRAHHRTDRVGEVDHACRDHRPGQPLAPGPHHHH
jgi:twitching motility protein PilT